MPIITSLETIYKSLSYDQVVFLLTHILIVAYYRGMYKLFFTWMGNLETTDSDVSSEAMFLNGLNSSKPTKSFENLKIVDDKNVSRKAVLSNSLE